VVELDLVRVVLMAVLAVAVDTLMEMVQEIHQQLRHLKETMAVLVEHTVVVAVVLAKQVIQVVIQERHHRMVVVEVVLDHIQLFLVLILLMLAVAVVAIKA
jgi:hypothetical protein